jgi:hypothetical protein
MDENWQPGRGLDMAKMATLHKTGIVRTAFVIAALLIVAGCSGQPLSTREKGTLIGGGLGAATGAIIGAAVGAPGAGAAIGGALGAGGGFIVGNQMQNTEVKQQQTQGQISQQQQQIERQQREIEKLKQQGETE